MRFTEYRSGFWAWYWGVVQQTLGVSSHEIASVPRLFILSIPYLISAIILRSLILWFYWNMVGVRFGLPPLYSLEMPVLMFLAVKAVKFIVHDSSSNAENEHRASVHTNKTLVAEYTFHLKRDLGTTIMWLILGYAFAYIL